MSIVNLARFSGWIEKRFNTKGSNAVSDIEGALRPVIEFPFDGDQRYLAGWDMFGAAAAAAASAANVSGFRLRNPPGSNVVGVVLKIVFSVNPQMAVSLNISNTITVDLGTPMTGQKLDRRIQRINSSLFMSNQNTSPTITSGNIILTLNPAITVNFDIIATQFQTIPLLPGDSLDLIGNTVNTTLGAGFWWMERPLETSELT